MKTPALILLTTLTSVSITLAVDPPPDGGYPGDNTAEGTDALFSLTGGMENTAVGADALHGTTGGIGNTGVGHSALLLNTTGDNNTAIGALALYNNTVGGDNTASGDYSLYTNTTGQDNTADGHFALYHNTTGPRNTSIGYEALYDNTSGQSNTASGCNSLYHNKVGSRNIALGFSAGMNLTTGNNNIEIGNVGSAGESSTIRIGTNGTQLNTYVAGVNGVTVAGGVGVMIDSSGHLGSITSSARYKEDIQPMVKASEAILSLQPVTFHYKKELDPDAVPQFGLVAEEVEKVNPALVARDEEGKAYSVRYEAVNAMLLNEFLKEHRRVEEQARTNRTQGTTIEQQEKRIEALELKLKEQAILIEKIDAQLTANQMKTTLVDN